MFLKHYKKYFKDIFITELKLNKSAVLLLFLNRKEKWFTELQKKMNQKETFVTQTKAVCLPSINVDHCSCGP